MKYDLTPEEESDAREFLAGRHPESEWEAFFAYYSMPRWKRRVSAFCAPFIQLVLRMV